MSSSSFPAPQPNRAVPPAPPSRSTNKLVALLWASALIALLLAIAAPRGFAPMPSWGRAGVNLKLAADGKTVLAAIVHSAGQSGADSSGTLVGVDAAKKTITLQDDHDVLTTYPVAPSATITLDSDAATLEKLPIGVWSAEFTANNTATVIRSVSVVAIVAAGCFSLAAVLARRKRTPRSVMWIRHLLISGYVLFGLYLFAGVRIINLIQEKNLMVQLASAQAPATAAPTAPGATSLPPATAPTTQKVKTQPPAAPSHTPAPGGVSVPTPSMRTDGIDLDTPVKKPAVTSDAPASKPAPALAELGPATQPSPQVKTAGATTQPTTQAAAGEPGPPRSSAEATTEEPPEADFLTNQYLLYLRTPWNLIGALAVFALATLVILAHISAWDLARSTVYVTEGAHANIGKQDVAYHSNLDSSIVVHVLIILIIPLLLQLHLPNRWARGALDFSMAGGGGSSEPIQVKIVKKKPHKKVKKYVFRKNSGISFYVPNMDTDSHVVEMTDAQTQEQYTATSGTGGGNGRGRGKGKGHGNGWGTGTGKVRFYHLQYSGANTDWNDGFTDGKDGNLLTEWEDRERKEGSDLPFGGVVVLTTSQLRPDAHGFLPAFIFITGNANAMTAHETDQIRQYILKGGMIFADPQYNWQAGFVDWARRLFPDERMIPLDNSEDDIYTSRYTFSVPPQFWSGNRSYLGLKHGDRWVIICDRGRMADGWKSPINEDCVKMGINIIDYAHAHMMSHQ